MILDEVGNRYRRYLRTTFFLRDPGIRASFAEALEQENVTKGPFLEMTPRFKQGSSLRACLADWFPAEIWEEGFLRAINADRPLYQHQEDAMRAALNGQNVIVATGTGSGKTEAFLLPILLHLYRTFDDKNRIPGVRALILYPMNALVADQRERLGTVARDLARHQSRFQFSFGQYIGATPDSERDTYREPFDLYPNELGTRREMQENPPDILITNYSMLEYLLIRPADSPLFDNGKARFWRFLVLDEAHQYRGAKGMEMTMLLRRLKDRLITGGRTGGFTCIATSASLADPGEAAQLPVSQFAATLFGEPFSAPGVILGTTDPIHFVGQESRPGSVYQAYLERFGDGPSSFGWLTDALIKDQRVARLADLLTSGPKPVEQLAATLFPGTGADLAYQYVDDLVTCVVTARDDRTGMPLLPVRHHFLLRALEGVRLSFYPRPRAYLTGGGQLGEQAVFELALCHHCGQHFIAGRVLGERMAPAITDPGHEDYHPAYYLPLTDSDNILGDDDTTGETVPAAHLTLCALCGTVGQGAELPCRHRQLIGLRVVAEHEGKYQCPVCDTQGQDLIGPILHGADGPHAVVATALYASLDEEHRKILAFADSRQRAAFFAWYLQDSYEAIARRNVLYQSLKELASASEDIGIDDLVAAFGSRLQTENMVAPSTTSTRRKHAARVAVLKEVVSGARPISLEAVGLVYGRVKLPPWITFSEDLLRPWGISVKIAQELGQWLLSTLVEDGAADFDFDDDPLQWSELEVDVPHKVAVVGPRAGAATATAIDGPKTRRVQLTKRLLAALPGQPVNRAERPNTAERLIRTLLETILEAEERVSARDRVLLAMKPGYRVNLRWWRWHLWDRSDLARCGSCHRLSHWNLAGLCPRFRCQGTLESVDAALVEDNHYRGLYCEALPGQLRAEEHTAQLERSQALQFQREFKQGHIHVLSSSTTFELGVDLGDLNVVFLRNVPPENFNYAQRVGRAGRRPGEPGVAVTYCGRSPHDLYHFDVPERMIAGNTRPPVLKVGNPALVLRHWTAVILSQYFRNADNASRFNKVENFFGRMDRPDILPSLREFVKKRQHALDTLFDRLIPAEAQNRMEEPWLGAVLGPDSRLARSVQEVAGDWRRVSDLEERMRNERNYRSADWARKRGHQIARQDVLSFLSQKVIIPKYGFPVDVVDLQLLSDSAEAQTVTLQRDLSLAIAEFAPSAEVVANKRVWTSRALKTVPDMAWPRESYRRCFDHGRMEREPFNREPCCSKMQEAEYIIPVFGFTTSREMGAKPRRPIDRLFTTRPFFADPEGWGPAPIAVGEAGGQPVMEAYNVRPGDIVVICEGRTGRGFYICSSCGGADTKKLKKQHIAPFGGLCGGTVGYPVALAHKFTTDILRLAFPHSVASSAALSFGVAYAIQYGAAELLEVPVTDLNALGLRTTPLSVLLYDNVPGGAGLVSQLVDRENLIQCVERALDRVSGRCGCGADSSCYGCLRSYGNQFLHHELKRGGVHEFLLGVRAAITT